MANIPNTRRGNTVVAHIKLKDGGLLIPWSDFTGIRVDAYSVEQRMLAAQCEAVVNEDDATILDVTYSGDSMQYLGLCKVIVRGTYDSRKKTYDAPLVNFVADTAQATGVIVVTDPEVNVLIDVQEVSTSVLDEAIAAAIAAAEHAEDTASKSPYIDDTTGNWMVYNAVTGEYVNSGVPATGPEGPQGVSPMEFGTGENSAYLDGSGSVASGQNSVAVGTNTRASGKGSHSEGNATVASGDNSHAEGYHTNATGDNSHAEGRYTEAQNTGEHAEGHYNVSIPVKTRHTVGIGTANNLRKNAHTITNDGKHYIPGIGGYEGTENTAEALAARQDLASVIATFVTRSVNDLANYYLKSETYTKTEVDAIVGALYQFHFEVYASLEAITSPSSNVLYLIGPTGSGADKYEEYVYSNSTFVKIGDTSIDLSGYVTTTALNTALATKVNVADIVDNLTTNDATKPLSAKQGKVLDEKVSQLGQYLNSLGSAVRGISSGFASREIQWTKGYLIQASNGKITTSCDDRCLVSNFIPVSEGDYYYIASRSSSNWFDIAGYSSNNEDSWVSTFETPRPSSDEDAKILKVHIPSGVNYIRLAYRTDYTEFAGIWDKGTQGLLDLLLSDFDVLREDYGKNKISMPPATFVGNSWDFLGQTVVAGKTYVIKAVTRENITINVGNEVGPVLYINKWVNWTPTESGTPYVYVGPTPGIQPVILFGEYNGTVADSKLQDDALREFEQETENNLNAVKDIAIRGFAYDVERNLSITQGQSHYSINDILNNVNYPAGKTFMLKLTGTTGVINKVTIVNQNWGTVYTNTDYVDGAVIQFKLTTPLTSMGLYVEPQNAVGTGALSVFVCSDYENEIAGRVNDLEDLANKRALVLEATAVSYGWAFDATFENGKTYYIKAANDVANNKAIGVGNSSSPAMSKNKWLSWVPTDSGTPYIYVGSTPTGTAPQIIVCKELDAFLADSINQDNNINQYEVKTHTINVSIDGTSKTGRTIHFSGLNAIKKAIDSITDAAPNNIYTIHVEGEFLFTNPTQQIDGEDVLMLGGGEYSIALMKDHVYLEGDGADRSALIMDFPANATFHDGKIYSDYQPIYFFGEGGKVSNIKVVGRNCRYAFHIEYDNSVNSYNKVIDIDNCVIDYLGHPDYEGIYAGGLATGMSSGQTWNIRNCVMSAFAMHSPLAISIAKNPSNVNFLNCTFGRVGLSHYPVNVNTFVTFVSCNFDAIPELTYSYNELESGAPDSGDYHSILTKGDVKALFRNSYVRGYVLKFKSNSTGITSKIRFDTTSNAFNLLIGNSAILGDPKTLYGWDSKNGYVYRDGGVGISGQAFGSVSVDNNLRNMGDILGDCTLTNKVLIINVDGTDYTITFNEDFRGKNNQYVIDFINNVVGSVATASVFSPCLLHYPQINGLQSHISDDDGAILSGMGVVFTANGMRRAKSTDGYIDGICLDDTSKGQAGRIITKGYIYTYSARTSSIPFFTIIDNAGDVTNSIGQTMGISSTNDGEFVIDNNSKLLRIKQGGCVEIL